MSAWSPVHGRLWSRPVVLRRRRLCERLGSLRRADRLRRHVRRNQLQYDTTRPAGPPRSPAVCLSACLPVCLLACLSTCLLVCFSSCLPVDLFVSRTACPCPLVCPSDWLSAFYLSACLSCLSACLYPQVPPRCDLLIWLSHLSAKSPICRFLIRKN